MDDEIINGTGKEQENRRTGPGSNSCHFVWRLRKKLLQDLSKSGLRYGWRYGDLWAMSATK